MSKLRTLIVLSLLVSGAAGCSMLYELQPHRLRKLNSGPAPSFDPEFGLLDSATSSSVASTVAPQPPLARAQNPR